MSNIFTAVGRLFGAADTSPHGVIKADREKAHEEFKVAVREGDLPKMEALLASKRIALGDEVGGGRGLLQFAVMAKSVKGVKLLVARGASTTAKDSLGASAETLAKKSGNENIIGSLQPA